MYGPCLDWHQLKQLSLSAEGSACGAAVVVIVVGGGRGGGDDAHLAADTVDGMDAIVAVVVLYFAAVSDTGVLVRLLQDRWNTAAGGCAAVAADADTEHIAVAELLLARAPLQCVTAEYLLQS